MEYIWLKPDHEEIQKKNDDGAEERWLKAEAAGKTIAPEDKRLTPLHFVVSLDYGKAFPAPVASEKEP